ncbi:hypothetical protein FOL46_008760 [Perkinsus olseni]|uniref:Uncharacterized protein n=1 Tax=Perkinsus olseni TaxID=32597 RepID=A0A7J6L564_PEROL|nr:hypothetical protein FOL46_008760 [Perkinsus olseni]
MVIKTRRNRRDNDDDDNDRSEFVSPGNNKNPNPPHDPEEPNDNDQDQTSNGQKPLLKTIQNETSRLSQQGTDATTSLRIQDSNQGQQVNMLSVQDQFKTQDSVNDHSKTSPEGQATPQDGINIQDQQQQQQLRSDDPAETRMVHPLHHRPWRQGATPGEDGSPPFAARTE